MRSTVLVSLATALVSISLSATAIAAPAPNMQQDAILYVQNLGILPNAADGQFHPERAISRLELIEAVVHDVYMKDLEKKTCFDDIAPSIPAHYTHLFSDVSRESDGAYEVCIGMFAGIVNGRTDGSLGVNQSANLVEVAKIVTKAYGIAPPPPLNPESKVPWHESFWFALARRDAIPASVHSRNQHITRGEFAQILYALRAERPVDGKHFTPTSIRSDSEAGMSIDVPSSSNVPAWVREPIPTASQVWTSSHMTPRNPEYISWQEQLFMQRVGALPEQRMVPSAFHLVLPIVEGEEQVQ